MAAPLGLARSGPSDESDESRHEEQGGRCIEHLGHLPIVVPRFPFPATAALHGRMGAMSSLLAASNPTVTGIGVVLVAVGFLLVVVTVRLWRAAAVDPEVLAPLEMMASRRFTRADDEARGRILDEVRHPGAVKIERLFVEPASARVSRRHRRRIERMEAEQQEHHLDAHVMRSDDSREIDLRASDRPSPDPLPWDDPSDRSPRSVARRAPDQTYESDPDDEWSFAPGQDPDDIPRGGIDPLLGGGSEGRRRRSRDERRGEDPSSWGEYE